MIIVSIVRLFPDTVDVLSPPLASLGPRYCRLLRLRCAGARTSDTDNETLQPTVLSPETLTFTLELVNANLEFLGFRLQRSLALLFFFSRNRADAAVLRRRLSSAAVSGELFAGAGVGGEGAGSFTESLVLEVVVEGLRTRARLAGGG